MRALGIPRGSNKGTPGTKGKARNSLGILKDSKKEILGTLGIPTGRDSKKAFVGVPRDPRDP